MVLPADKPYLDVPVLGASGTAESFAEACYVEKYTKTVNCRGADILVIDLHSHILPGVDDGVATLDEALEMAQMAVDCGVFHMVATPHYNYFGHTTVEQIRAAFARLQDGLEYEQIPLQLYLGMENIASEHLPVHLRQGSALTYPDSPWFLVEFLAEQSPAQVNAILNRCVQEGFLPVIAHAERYPAVLDDPRIAKEWIDKGWGVQVTRDSLLGRFGRQCMECADFMMEQGWVTCIVSDAHGIDGRNTDWEEAWQVLQQRYSHHLLHRCLESNPQKILNGESLDI